MGNFSRDTFDKLKRYVGVRLQQGVPLVDADWNELNDITRHELYDGLNQAFSDGVRSGSSDLVIRPREGNDLTLGLGSVLIRGRPLFIREDIHYSTQPWMDPDRAAQDEVEVIPPIPPPPEYGRRTDIVYLDVWEREVGSDQDPNLINPAIGIETSVRLKREAAFRVEEGQTTIPPAHPGHFFMPLALLNRQAEHTSIWYDQIEDIRPFIHGPQGERTVSFLPAFLPITVGTAPVDAWSIRIRQLATPYCDALQAPTREAYGMLPLVLPDGARMTKLLVCGITRGELRFVLLRHKQQIGLSPEKAVDMLVSETFCGSGGYGWGFHREITIPSEDRKNIVDNSEYYYSLLAYSLLAEESDHVNYEAIISGISIRYDYGL